MLLTSIITTLGYLPAWLHVELSCADSRSHQQPHRPDAKKKCKWWLSTDIKTARTTYKFRALERETSGQECAEYTETLHTAVIEYFNAIILAAQHGGVDKNTEDDERKHSKHLDKCKPVLGFTVSFYGK